MSIKNRIARMFGRTRVLLHDSDGEITIRWARKVSGGMICYRFSGMVDKCLLREGGELEGPCYVLRWSKG